jgi:hypothetical protein
MALNHTTPTAGGCSRLQQTARFRPVATFPRDIWCCAALRKDLIAFERRPYGSQMEVTDMTVDRFVGDFAWEESKVRVMHGLVLQKFTRHPELGEQLLATRGRELIEGNTWGDRFWGVCGGQGQNYFGHILMEVRAYLAGRCDAR